jgi:hypothetical protein
VDNNKSNTDKPVDKFRIESPSWKKENYDDNEGSCEESSQSEKFDVIGDACEVPAIE